MREIQTYLAGSMSGLTFEEYNGWRKEVEKGIKDRNEKVDIRIINPVDFFNFEKKLHQSDFEIMQFELNAVKKSDFVIANLCFSNSTGTNIEIYEAYTSGIPVLALVDDVHKQHPWVNEMVTRTFYDMDELLDYVNYYYLF